jgi:hypothetical protein
MTRKRKNRREKGEREINRKQKAEGRSLLSMIDLSADCPDSVAQWRIA